VIHEQVKHQHALSGLATLVFQMRTVQTLGHRFSTESSNMLDYNTETFCHSYSSDVSNRTE